MVKLERAGENPGNFELSLPKLAAIDPEFRPRGWRKLTKSLSRDQQRKFQQLQEQLAEGELAAAVVICENPFLIAVYFDEIFDSVVLEFPSWLRQDESHRYGDQLLAVVTYQDEDEVAKDLRQFPGEQPQVKNFTPQIVNFLVNDQDAVQDALELIPQYQWFRTEQTGSDYLMRNVGAVREGTPSKAGISAL